MRAVSSFAGSESTDAAAAGQIDNGAGNPVGDAAVRQAAWRILEPIFEVRQWYTQTMFRQVAVIGAGTMGAGIAGQVANSGTNVLLLDLPANGSDVNANARRGLERLRQSGAPGLMSDAAAERVQIGNTRDDLHRLADCDWVAEAVVERLAVKHALYRDLEPLLQPDAILTSNTSTIPIRLLVEGMDESLTQRFAITHFFNPVRYMRLLELVRGTATDERVLERLGAFCEQQLGKGVVNCADTPGFLANRVGCFAIQCALHEAFARGLTPAEADAVFGRPMGIPKTGVFGLYDLIGIDLMSDVAASLVSILPQEDAFQAYGAPIPFMQTMIDRGQTGNKQRQGFYRQGSDHSREMIDLQTGDYQPAERLSIGIADQAEKHGVKHLLDDDSRYGHYAWSVLSQTLVYAASLIPEVGKDPLAIDDAMKLGYNWQRGPFELIDEIGVDAFAARLRREGHGLPDFLDRAAGSRFYRVAGTAYQRRVWQTPDSRWQAVSRPDGVLRWSEISRTLQARQQNASASWYACEEVAVVEFHTKANALDGDSMVVLADALEAVKPAGLRGLVVHNDAQHFSCGVNLDIVRRYARAEDWEGLDAFLAHFQQTVLKMAQADFPVLAAPAGLSIGGGFEVVLHAQRVIAHANSVMGLVESLVGLIPGGGGCKETLYRWVEQLGPETDDIEAAAWRAFKAIGYGRTATSPVQAQEQAMLGNRDTWLMNRDRQLSAALASIRQHPTPTGRDRPALRMPGRQVVAAMGDWLDQGLDEGRFTPHDTVVGRAIATIVAGDCEAGTLWSEQDLFDAERRAFLMLAQTPATQARIDSMLDLGQTLRN